MQKLYRYTVFFSGKQQNIVIFAKKFLPDKDLDKYFLPKRVIFCTLIQYNLSVNLWFLAKLCTNLIIWIIIPKRNFS